MTLLWKPTLSATLPLDFAALVPWPVYASPKIDGWRVMVQRGVLVTRSGLPVKNRAVQTAFGRADLEGLDCELTDGLPYGPEVFDRARSLASKADGGLRQARLNVIDWHGAAMVDFSKRYKELSVWLSASGRGVCMIKQTLISTPDQLLSYEATALEKGYEGVMLRRADGGPYVQKRSTLKEFDLVRLKRRERGTCTLLSVRGLEHNTNTLRTAAGRKSTAWSGVVVDPVLMGSVAAVDDKTGIGFELTLSSAEIRAWPGWSRLNKWRGRHVTYTYQAVGMLPGEAPRQPTATFKELL